MIEHPNSIHASSQISIVLQGTSILLTTLLLFVWDQRRDKRARNLLDFAGVVIGSRASPLRKPIFKCADALCIKCRRCHAGLRRGKCKLHGLERLLWNVRALKDLQRLKRTSMRAIYLFVFQDPTFQYLAQNSLAHSGRKDHDKKSLAIAQTSAAGNTAHLFLDIWIPPEQIPMTCVRWSAYS